VIGRRRTLALRTRSEERLGATVGAPERDSKADRQDRPGFAGEDQAAEAPFVAVEVGRLGAHVAGKTTAVGMFGMGDFQVAEDLVSLLGYMAPLR